MDQFSTPKQLVAAGYDRIGETYNSWAQSVRVAERQRYTQLVLDRLPAGADLLELGCATGLLTTDQFRKEVRAMMVAAKRRPLLFTCNRFYSQQVTLADSEKTLTAHRSTSLFTPSPGDEVIYTGFDHTNWQVLDQIVDGKPVHTDALAAAWFPKMGEYR